MHRAPRAQGPQASLLNHSGASPQAGHVLTLGRSNSTRVYIQTDWSKQDDLKTQIQNVQSNPVLNPPGEATQCLATPSQVNAYGILTPRNAAEQ